MVGADNLSTKGSMLLYARAAKLYLEQMPLVHVIT